MARRDRLIRYMLRERFVFTLKDGTTFEAILDDHDETLLELVDAYLLAKNQDRVAVDGKLYLPRADLAYMQRPGVS